jgi:aspartyl-tRNA(Asn)/glutamyl-tRNA(Gln) amidotransferase subunit A
MIFLEFLRLEGTSGHPASTIDDIEQLVARTFETPPRPPRLGRLRGEFERRADPTMREALDRALDALAAEGAEICDVVDPFDFNAVARHHRVIMAAEAAFGHADRFRAHRDVYGTRITALIEEGQGIAATAYLEARHHQEALRTSIGEGLAELDALVMPATVGEAPDPSTTGDPALNSPWSYTGSPALSFPIGLSAGGMPLALQLVEPRPLSECDLIETACWCEAAVRRAERARSA